MIRSDHPERARRHAARALDVAFSLRCNGPLATMAWCAAGCPKRDISPHDVEVLQQARLMIRLNGGHVTAGDVERLVERLLNGGGRS